MLLLTGGKLVAILVELADEGHGEERGNWVVEMIFGVNNDRVPGSFLSAAEAADWVSRQVGGKSFMLTGAVLKLA